MPMLSLVAGNLTVLVASEVLVATPVQAGNPTDSAVCVALEITLGATANPTVLVGLDVIKSTTRWQSQYTYSIGHYNEL
jgi:hypothetical protein